MKCIIVEGPQGCGKTSLTNYLRDNIAASNLYRLTGNKDKTITGKEKSRKMYYALLNYMNNICSNCSSKEEAIQIVSEHQDNFKQVALETIIANGYNYNVNIKVGNFEFPTKQYGDISLPAGFYDALRVEIGQAEGRNWWCVMFPSLCFVDISSGIVPDESKEELQDALSKEEYSLISNNSDNEIKFKFKLIEFFANNGLLTAKK